MRRRLLVGAALSGLLFGLPAEGRADWLDDVMDFFGFGPSAPVATPAADSLPPPELFPRTAKLTVEASSEIRVAENGGKVSVRLTRSVSYDRRVVVTVRSARSGSPAAGLAAAEPGKNFEAVTREVVFEPDEREKTVDIAIIDNDVILEGDRTFDLVFADPRDATLAGPQVIRVVVVEDDTARPGRLAPESASVSFDTVEVGQESAAGTLWWNRGDTPLTVGRVGLEPSGTAFFVTKDECTGKTLPGGASCRIGLSFAPTRDETSSARLIVGWSERGTGATSEMSVGGTGLAKPLPPDPMIEAVARAKREREAAGAAVVDLRPEVRPSSAKPEFRNREAAPGLKAPSHEQIGLGLAPWTFPRDRTRIITTTRFIRCVLETTIDSSLPGSVICTVESHVFGADGRKILVPAGTRIEGDYIPLSKTGETRLNVVWKRFERPDGSSFYTRDGFEAKDAIGRTGVPGWVDSRLSEKYGSAAFVTAIASAFAYMVPPTDERMIAAQETAADNLGSVVKQQLEESFDLRPIIQIPAGTRLVIKPLKDMWFPVPELLAEVENSGGAVADESVPAGRSPSGQRATPR